MISKLILTAVSIFSFITLAGTIVIGSSGFMKQYSEKAKIDRPALDLAPLSIGNPAALKKPLTMVVPNSPLNFSKKPLPKFFSQTLKARSGDTLADILSRVGINSNDIHKSILALQKNFNPRNFRLGQNITIFFESDVSIHAVKDISIGRFLGFSIQSDLNTSVRVKKTKFGTFKSYKIDRKLKAFFSRAEGEIQSSLYASGKKAGLSDSTLAELIRIYSWDIDFQRDIRKGDYFQVLFEKIFDEKGVLERSNKIFFASLTLTGKPHSIYRFTNNEGTTGFYDEKGLSVRKALMRTPIDGAKLSSRFGKRKHPILGYNKMHKGIDFAAPTGTPIYAAGNGTISKAGWNGAYGRFLLIRHNTKYSSAYAHLRKFALSIKLGKRVKQGEIIGYVGSSGRSTGPHLHYEIRYNGRRINPLRVKMPSGKKLLGNEIKRFQKLVQEIDSKFAMLEMGASLTISKN